ncbi:nitric oxide reductase transcriptional regulator NorR [Motilimonas cestriensis]|uniref:Nitric oxide reductase transcriptional regulator NorR n=1 Tax=Motilimonas cestriensis TaxID=2742685 RepID=A0ABS8WFT1_9GAMM|nr:nitric oxide reductase transcriptional regulator NorR [Motilimonas cestriensis]MCE2596601.1 nitric oxide reductase transcriptional regulator NorR [Motilimonas cestriensis]
MAKISSQWLQVALDLNSSLSSQDRFERLLSTIRRTLNCDASALLLFQEQHFIPLAINGLADEVLGRRFAVSAHPRLEAIARAGDVVRFPADSDLPDPYDGLIPNHDDKLQVHSCIGLPLIIGGRLLGAMTIDAFDPEQFEDFADDELRIVSALTASALHGALLLEQLEKQTLLGHEPLTEKHSIRQEMIGTSAVMTDLRAQINAVANTDLTVLVTGETGVGKELVANAMHFQSARASENLVYLNCAALPESVAESELFGHVKGAFTGAISHRKGKFEQADNGTLFLDEVAELTLTLQAKLLRALQFGDIQRVGDDCHIRVNTRIVAATNRSLDEEVRTGRFRADLYHRLSVFPLFVPPLRDREGDVVLLAGFFAERCRQKLGLSGIRLDDSFIAAIKQHHWPGNIRELEHVINRAAVIARVGDNLSHLVLTAEMLLPELHAGFAAGREGEKALTNVPCIENETSAKSAILSRIEVQGVGLKLATQQFQKDLIAQCYRRNNNNWASTARDLELDNGNLHRLAKKLGLK